MTKKNNKLVKEKQGKVLLEGMFSTKEVKKQKTFIDLFYENLNKASEISTEVKKPQEKSEVTLKRIDLDEKEFFDKYFVANEGEENRWLRLDYVLRDFYDIDALACVGDNTLGKSYSIENWFIDLIIQHHKMIWGRLFGTEAEKCVYSWNIVLERHKDKLKGKKWKVDKSGVSIDGKLVVPFVYMNSLTSSTPPIEGTYTMCLDEFLDMNQKRKFTMLNPLANIKKLMDRTRANFNRKNAPLVFLANPHILESDFLSDLHCDADWKLLHHGKNILQLITTSTGMKVLFLVIQDVSSIHNEIIARQKEQEQKLGIKKYEFPHPSLKNIYVDRPKACIPYMKFNHQGRENQFIIWKSIYDRFFWVNKIDEETDKYDNIPYYSFDIESHTSRDIYLGDMEKCYNVMKDILEFKIFGDRLLYQSPYIRDEIFMNIIERIEKFRQTINNNKNN